jgi:hypothetical protein
MRPVIMSTVVAVAALGACGNDRPPPARAYDFRSLRDASTGPDFHIEDPGPPDPDSSALCGSLVVPVAPTLPNLYFVLDASGSMGLPLDPPQPGISNLYWAARSAIADVLRAVGHRVRYGAALFPGNAPIADVPCPAGVEAFSTREGDDVSYALTGKDGPVLERLLVTLAGRRPEGTTPTAATLRALRPTLEALGGETYVFLITDGAPNCNEDAACTGETCEANIVGDCPPEVNCCDPSIGPYAHLGCIDGDATVGEVAALAAVDIKTFVIGLPGSEAFSDLLDRVALAGLTGRDRSPYFYPVEQASQLSDLLRRLGATLAVDCTVALKEPPPDPSRVNVYFDTFLLPRDVEDGWRWEAADRIEIVGPSCDHLQGGDVLQVQIAAGCPTVVR